MQKDELPIYHGSISIIDSPEFGKGKKNNDYGRGFYCTENLELAKEWAVDLDRDGYANKYILDTRGLKILDLSKSATALNWITILIQNRVFLLNNDVAKAGKKFLIDNYNIPTNNYDVIKGYRADDSYFAYAESFLNNTISIQRLTEALRLGNLGEQIVLISKKAFEQIRFTGYELADSKLYYPLRKERNEAARNEFLRNKQGATSKDALYLSDIMRGVSPNDPRLR